MRRKREPLEIISHVTLKGILIDPIKRQDLRLECAAVDKTIKTGQQYTVKPA